MPQIGSSFEYSSRKPLDARQQCESLEALKNNINNILYPPGFKVYCLLENKEYKNTAKLNETPIWEEVDTASQISIKDTSEAFEGGNVEKALEELANKRDTHDSLLTEHETKITEAEEAIKWLKENSGSATGKTPYISTTLSEDLMVNTGENLNLMIDFYSPNIGAGTLKVFINDVDSYTGRVAQGETTTLIKGELFTKGSNKVVVYVVDRIGTMSNSLTFYVRYGGLEFESTFDSEMGYDIGSNVRYYFTPSSIDTSLSLTFYMEIDGVQNSMSCTSDVRSSYTFSNNLEAGRHSCKAWISDGTNNSPAKEFNLILLNNTNIVIASNTKNLTVEEGYQVVLDYKVYKKNDTTFNTKLYIDNELISTGTCSLETQYYRNSTLIEGTHTIKIEVSDVLNTVSDYITWTIVVTKSLYELLKPSTSGAIFLGTAKNRNNTDSNKGIWQGTDQDGNKIDTLLNNFTFNSENGWINDALVISGDSNVEIPISPLSDNAKYGLTVDIEFMTKSIGVENAEVFSVWDDEKNVGIKITLEELIIKSTDNEKRLYFGEEENISAIFVIDRDEKTAKIYLNGVMCGGFALGDYVADGVPHLENFTTNSQVILGGRNTNGYCEVKNLRIYSIALGTNEIMNNYLSNFTNKSEQKAKVKFQKGDDLSTITVYGDFSGLGKNDKKPCDIVYQSTDVTKYGESFRLEGKYSMLQYQGTSSMQYPIKNYRLNPRDAKGKVKLDPFNNGTKESRFTLKADSASSGHWQNTGLAKWVNDKLYHYNEKDSKSMNPKKWFDLQNGGKLTDTRETINGFPCRLILINNGDTPLQEGQQEPTPGNTKDMGVFNFNNDKSNTDTLGFDIKNFPFCASFEVASNSDTSAGAFMSYCGDVLDYVVEDAVNVSMYLPIRILGDTVATEWYKTIKFYDKNKVLLGQVSATATPTKVLDGAEYFRISGVEQIKINGKQYYVGEKKEKLVIATPTCKDSSEELNYIKESFELRFPDEDDVGADYGFLNMNGDTTKGLKRVIDFVDKSSDEDFIAHFEEYFNKQYTFRYFLLVMALGMVDNLGKNMMLDTWDGQIFYPRFYDMDTICSFNNSGVITFDTDIEMAQGYWNTSNSRLWTRIRDLFHPELVAIYKDMRQYGLSYDTLMHYFYDEQIALIPEAYYNKDYDVKYAPYANEYMGMANGSAYEHLKRWLKRRLLFTDSLYDYVPSYADSITIRANTTKGRIIEIETYAPVYQHMSWYNNQMDKKKIDGKTAITFTCPDGTGADTDQEVIIYGGSNLKRIRGLNTLNPDSMLIGNASKLVELECSNAPLLTNINQNKANLSPNKYLTKVDISNCPQLGGTLRLNNSPLLSEVNAQGTAITGMLLPTSIKNLAKLKVPKGVTELILNDAKTLTDLDLEKGYLLETLSLSNCNKLKSFELSKVKNISLDNSYNAEELRLSTNEQVNLKNMSSLKRLVYTPNNESEDFDLTVLKNSPNVTVSTFNCPQLKDFITTAPQRLSYGETDDNICPYKLFMANKLDLSNTQLETVKFLCTTDVFDLKLPKTVKNFYCDSAFDLDTNKITKGAYDVIHSDLIRPYTEEYNENVYLPEETTITCKATTDYTGIWTKRYVVNGGNFATGTDNWIATARSTDYLLVFPNTPISLTSTAVSDNGVCIMFFNKDKTFIGYINNSIDKKLVAEGTVPNDCRYVIFSVGTRIGGSAESQPDIAIKYTSLQTPNIIPTSANGSLLFNINQDTPQNNSPYIWDLQGLTLNDFYTYGVNNKVNCEMEAIGIDKMYGLYRGTSNTSLGNTYTPEIATTGTQTLISPIRVSKGDTIVVNSQSKNSGFKYAIVDENNKVLKARESSYTNINNRINIDIENANKIIIDFFEGEEIGNELKVVINNILYNVEIISDKTKILNDVIDLSKYYNKLNNSSSITMPKRLADYKVQIKNADITPNQYNTMLYPKLVDTTLPITGKLDYSKFKGKYLSWAFAYTTNDVVRTALDSRKQGQIINDYNKLYGTDYIDIIDVWAYKGDDFSNRATNNNITKAYIELTQTNYKTRIDEVLQWYPNCTELYLFEDGSVTNLDSLFGAFNKICRTRLKYIEFMDDYFNSLSSFSSGMRDCSKLERINRIPNSVKDLSLCFYGCAKFNQQLDLSEKTKLKKDSLNSAFFNCISLTHTPILPSNYTGNLEKTFYNTKITTAPVLPEGVTSLASTFRECPNLTTVGNIPSSCNSYANTFRSCKSLNSVPETGWKGDMSCTFGYSSINQKIVINSASSLDTTFGWCTSLKITPILPKEMKGSMANCFRNTGLTTPAQTPEGVTGMSNCYNGCTSLITAPYIPNTCTNIGNLVYSCNKLTEITIPLENIEIYINALYGTGVQTVHWVGKRKSNFDIFVSGLYGGDLSTKEYEQETLKSLVDDHLEDLYKDKIKINYGSKITINNIETTL